MEKILSIAVPSYNAEAYLEKGLGSFMCDCMEKLEIIVVNDGSTDGTLAIAKSYEEKYPDTFKIIDKPNGGHGSGINAAAKIACGRYFRVVDADDWVINIDEYIAELEESSADIVLTHFHTVDMQTGDKVEYANRGAEYKKDLTPEELVPMMSEAARWFQIHSIAYRTEFYRSTGLVLSEGVFYEDTEYAVIPFTYAKNIRLIDMFVYQYMVGNISQSVSVASYAKRYTHLEAVMSRLLDHYREIKGANAAADAFMQKRIAMLLGTYEKVMFIYLKDKKLGRERVKAVRKEIGETDKSVLSRIAKRHAALSVLGALHADPAKLETAYKTHKK